MAIKKAWAHRQHLVRPHFLGDPSHWADLEIWIDWEGLAKQLGGKAVRNRSDKTRMAQGAIVVKATNIEVVK